MQRVAKEKEEKESARRANEVEPTGIDLLGHFDPRQSNFSVRKESDTRPETQREKK